MMKTFAKTIGYLLILLLAFSCSKDESLLSTGDELSDAVLKTAVKLDGTYELAGETHFPAYAVKEHRVISPWEMNFLDCVAELTIEGHDFTLHTWEYFGDVLFREVVFTGNISSAGIVRFSWPEEGVLETMFEHTGCEMYGGPGVNNGTITYNGYFNGEEFYASIHVMGKQVQFGLVPFYAEKTEDNPIGLEALVVGPIQFDFSIELEVTD